MVRIAILGRVVVTIVIVLVVSAPAKPLATAGERSARIQLKQQRRHSAQVGQPVQRRIHSIFQGGVHGQERCTHTLWKKVAILEDTALQLSQSSKQADNAREQAPESLPDHDLAQAAAQEGRLRGAEWSPAGGGVGI